MWNTIPHLLAVCESWGVTSTDTHLTVVVHLTVAAERAYTVSAQFAEALRSAAGLPGIRMSVEGPGSPARIPQPRTPVLLRPEPELRILPAQRRVLRRGVDVELTRLEFDLLLFLCRNPGRVHHRSTLMSAVWKLEAPYRSRTIDVHVRRLRGKLDLDFGLITTVRGIGYRVDDTERVRVEDDLPVVQSA